MFQTDTNRYTNNNHSICGFLHLSARWWLWHSSRSWPWPWSSLHNVYSLVVDWLQCDVYCLQHWEWNLICSASYLQCLVGWIWAVKGLLDHLWCELHVLQFNISCLQCYLTNSQQSLLSITHTKYTFSQQVISARVSRKLFNLHISWQFQIQLTPNRIS